MQSGKPLHLMNDNPNQKCKICGGMWGAKLNSVDLRQDKAFVFKFKMFKCSASEIIGPQFGAV